MFSRACEYAFQAVLYIALHNKNNNLVGVKEIGSAQGIPLPFLSKILQKLVKGGILFSSKGPTGGFGLNVPPDELTLLAIVHVIDGLKLFDRCGIGLELCSDAAPCPIHQDFKIVKANIRNLLSNKTLSDLSQGLENGKFILSYIKGGEK